MSGGASRADRWTEIGEHLAQYEWENRADLLRDDAWSGYTFFRAIKQNAWSSVHCIVELHDNRVVLGMDYMLVVIDADCKELHRYPVYRSILSAIQLRGGRLVTGGDNKKMTIWDTNTFRSVTYEAGNCVTGLYEHYNGTILRQDTDFTVVLDKEGERSLAGCVVCTIPYTISHITLYHIPHNSGGDRSLAKRKP